MLTPNEVLNPKLEGLLLEKWEHLFHWPADLLYGDESATVSDEPETIKEPSFESFKYDRIRHDQKVRDFRHDPTQKTPGVSAAKFRQEIHWNQPDTPQGSRYSSNPRGFDAPVNLGWPENEFARPNTIATFQAWGRDKMPNPFLEEWGIECLDQKWDTPELDQDAYWDGLTWAVNHLFKTVVDFRVPRQFLQSLTLSGSVQLLLVHSQRKDAKAIGLAVDLLIDELTPINLAVVTHAGQIRREMQRWADQARFAVPTLEGEPDRDLTLINTATALVGMKQLWDLAGQLHSFKEGAIAVLGELERHQGQ